MCLPIRSRTIALTSPELIGHPRVENMCLGEYYGNQMPYKMSALKVYAPLKDYKSNVNEDCTLKWVLHKGSDKWEDVWHKYSEEQ